MKTLKGLLIWLLQACLMLLTFWLLTQLIWLGGAWYDVAAWALMPVLGLFSAYLVTRRGVNNYIAWLAPPVCAFFAHYIVTGYTPGGAVPPGTGDVPLTVFQSLPVDGIVVVASPQELVSMIVAKAVNMAEMMKVPMLGIVENMSYIVCPDCGKHINVFGNSHVDEVAAKHHLPVLAKCPIDPKLAELSDAGMIETYGGEFLEGAADACEKLLKK